VVPPIFFPTDVEERADEEVQVRMLKTCYTQ
jgi:hypothetical protein